jgi:hypothetical protein
MRAFYVIARSVSDEGIHFAILDCFAEPVIGPRFARTRWLAMTINACGVAPGAWAG